MKRTMIFCFILFFDKSFSQVKIEPFSIGVGQNTNTAIPLHINRSGEALRIQGIAPFLSFYSENNFSGYFQAINNTFEIGSNNGYPMHFYTNGHHRLTIKGNSHYTGIGILDPTEALDIDGSVKFNGNLIVDGKSGQAGDVFVSGGTNSPYWRKRATVSTNFYAQSFPRLIETFVNFSNEQFDNGNLLFDGVFTANQNGIFKIEVMLKFGTDIENRSKDFWFSIYKNDELTPFFSEFVSNTTLGNYNNTSGGFNVIGMIVNYKYSHSSLYNLTDGDKLKFKVSHTGYYGLTLLNKFDAHIVE